MIRKALRLRGNGLLRVLAVLLVVFGGYSMYASWSKTSNWKYSLSPYYDFKNLVAEVDKFFLSLVDADNFTKHSNLNFSLTTAARDHNSSKQSRLQLFRKHIKNFKNGSALKRTEEEYKINQKKLNLKDCPATPSRLKGWLDVPDMTMDDLPTLTQLEEKYPNHEDATWKPDNCKARYRVAIIIPLRGRELQLRGLLHHMHPIWQSQEIDYTVYTITQAGRQLFNRAKLMNVGFTEAMLERKYDCYVFHDVDLLLENDNCLYWCSPSSTKGKDTPRHLSTYIDKFGYAVHTYSLGLCSPLSFESIEMEVFGGVSMFTEEQFLSVNGFSNIYWGWGAEDDDIYLRSRKRGYSVYHDSSGACSYHMIYHSRERKNRQSAVRYLLLKHALSRQNDDGLNSLRYKVLSHEKHSIYTNITVDIGGPSQRLRDLTRAIFEGSEDIDSLSCFESMVWMYNKLVKKPKK